MTHWKKGRVVRRYNVKSPYKRIVKSLRYPRPVYTARKCIEVPALKKATLNEVLKVIKLESTALAKCQPKPSMLRVRSLKQLTTFKWSDLMTHLKQRAPTLLSIIEAAAKSPYRPSQLKKHTPLSSAVGMAACILLKQRCKHLCLLQVIISILLYAGHASKKGRNSQ